MYCMQLAEDTGRKNRQKFATWAPSHNFAWLYPRNMARIDNRKKFVKWQYLPKVCGVVQGMELRNFRRGRHLYSAGRPSRLASVHILVRLK